MIKTDQPVCRHIGVHMWTSLDITPSHVHSYPHVYEVTVYFLLSSSKHIKAWEKNNKLQHVVPQRNSWAAHACQHN